MKTDIEIAQSVELKPIYDVAAKAGIPANWVEPYGKYKAKILRPAGSPEGKPGKLILVRLSSWLKPNCLTAVTV